MSRRAEYFWEVWSPRLAAQGTVAFCSLLFSGVLHGPCTHGLSRPRHDFCQCSKGSNWVTLVVYTLMLKKEYHYMVIVASTKISKGMQGTRQRPAAGAEVL